MRISRDKLNKLAHVVADTLAEIDECEFQEDRNTVRQEARKVLETLLFEESKIDEAARLKISSQRRIIPEGSMEWDILYRKYYNEEVTLRDLGQGVGYGMRQLVYFVARDSHRTALYLRASSFLTFLNISG